MTRRAAYTVKTRPTAGGPQRAARYAGEPRPARRWRTRSSHTSLGAACHARDEIERGELFRIGAARVEAAIFYRGRRLRMRTHPLTETEGRA